MPAIIHILAEDLEGWEMYTQTSRSFHYRPRTEVLLPFTDEPLTISLGELAEQIHLVSPEPLDKLAGRDMFCFIDPQQKGWLSRKVGVHPELKFELRHPREELRNPRRLRLRIAAIDSSRRPPRVILEEWKT